MRVLRGVLGLFAAKRTRAMEVYISLCLTVAGPSRRFVCGQCPPSVNTSKRLRVGSVGTCVLPMEY